jgi:opacity protein-like surface antigen
LRAAVVALLLCAACAGGRHHRGDRAWAATAHWGLPITRDVLDLRGNGRANNAGATVEGHWFVRDRLALLATVTPLHVYDQSDGTAFAAGFAVGPRLHVWERGRFGLFGDVLGGIQLSTRSIPEEGTHYNWSLALGPGCEYELRDSLWLQLGYRFRHISNGRGRVASNPSQNDHFIWVGLAWSFSRHASGKR